MASLKGDEIFEVRYLCNDCTPSTGVQDLYADISEQITTSWLVKGAGGENIIWYWDQNYTQPLILGEDVRTEYCVYQSGKVLVFQLYGKMPMDIKLKMGAKSSLPSAKNKGTVYFAKNGDKNFGELYYDDENGNRVKVGGTNISNLTFDYEDINDLKLQLTLEDGTIIKSNSIPESNWDSLAECWAGIVSIEDQIFTGLKTFADGAAFGVPAHSETGQSFPSVYIGNPFACNDSSTTLFYSDDWIKQAGILLSSGSMVYGSGAVGKEVLSMCDPNSDDAIMFSVLPALLGLEAGVYSEVNIEEDRIFGSLFVSDVGAVFMDNASGTESIVIIANGTVVPSKALGTETMPVPIAYISSIIADEIQASTIIGNFTGDLEGTAHFATQWFAPITLNGTEVQGGETSEVITAKWGAARNISISSAAGTTGTSIDGSAEAGYTLVIPATMTGFTSITSATMLPTYLGSADAPVATSHVKEIYLHNPNNNTYKHKLTSNAGSANCDLQLPNTSGLLISKASTTASVGDTNSPVYVALNGEVTACSTIAVDHGGTGLNTVAAGSLLYGNGTGNMGTIAANAKGKLLGSNGTSAAPIYLEPTVSFTTGTSAPKVRLTINGVNYDSSAGIQSASASNPGIVSTGTQTFKGSKTFSDAATFSSGISSTTGTFSGQINANADIKLAGNLKSNSSGTSYVTLTDTRATITSPTLHLNGTTLVLNSSNYGTSLPTTGLEEGRVFFLLT